MAYSTYTGAITTEATCDQMVAHKHNVALFNRIRDTQFHKGTDHVWHNRYRREQFLP